MSASDLVSAVRQLQGRTLGVLWRQWGAVGASTTSDPARSLVDPEALVLMSLAMQDEERRLRDVLRWWAKTGAPLLNVTRIRTLAKRFPDFVRGRLGDFAYSALHDGRDFRWRPLIRPVGSIATRRGKTVETAPRFTRPPALPLRLRLAFGVTVKADLLTMLLGTTGAWLTVKVLAESLGYTGQSVRRAADDLVMARLIQATGKTPIGYRVDPGPWAEFLGTTVKIPRWHSWVPVFAFVAGLAVWIHTEADSASATDYVLSSTARDVVVGYEDAFTRNRLRIAHPEDFPGETYLPAFLDTLMVLGKWLDESA